ncbi:tyrosine-type recombinase/integrase [Salipiger marinus]|uniref:tyrosine-type recombinase/integrase n=1 Tax=Salipiger marinus TaxID=555512 RepID=UPI0040594673
MATPLEQIDQRIRDLFQKALNEGHAFRQVYGPDIDKADAAESVQNRQKFLTASLQSQQYDTALYGEAKTLVGQLPHNPTISQLDAIHHACEGILRARIEADRILAARLRGEFHLTAPIDPLFTGMAVTDLPPLPGEVVMPKLTLADASKKFADFQIAKGNKNKTLGDFELTMGWVFSVVDPAKPIEQVTKDDVRAVRDLLGALPKNMDKNSATKGLNATEAAAAGVNMPKLAPKTQRKRLAAFTGLLRWAVSEGYTNVYAGEGIGIVAKAKKTLDRKPYSLDQLTQVFSCPIYTGRKSLSHYNVPGGLLRKDYLFWLPLIALFTGMRAGEILQLTKNDVKTAAGISYFDINKWEDIHDEVDKSLKTEASERRVPIHSVILGVGFLGYVAAQPKGRIFAAAKLGSDETYTQYYSKQWRMIAQKAGFYTPQTVFHSFRHNFVDACRDAKVPESIAMQIVGHKNTKTHGGYGSGASLKVLKEEIERVSYSGLDLGHLSSNNWSY